MRTFVTKSDFYLTHLGFHVGVMQYDGKTGDITLYMVRCPLNMSKVIKDKVIKISKELDEQVLARLKRVLEHYKVDYEVCKRVITQLDLEYLLVGKKTPTQVSKAVRTYKLGLKDRLDDEQFMMAYLRQDFMEIVYLYYLGL